MARKKNDWILISSGTDQKKERHAMVCLDNLLIKRFPSVHQIKRHLASGGFSAVASLHSFDGISVKDFAFNFATGEVVVL